MKARRALASDLLAQGVQLSEVGVAIAKKFEMPEKQAKKWVYNNHAQLKARQSRRAKAIEKLSPTSAADAPGPADAINDAPPAVRPIRSAGIEVHAVSIPLVTASRALLILRRELSRGEAVEETCASLEDAIAKAIGL